MINYDNGTQITKQMRSMYIKRARDAKCEAILMTYEQGDHAVYPYYVSKRENVEWERYQLEDEGIEVLEEIYI